jgi:hypothetical protein
MDPTRWARLVCRGITDCFTCSGRVAQIFVSRMEDEQFQVHALKAGKAWMSCRHSQLILIGLLVLLVTCLIWEPWSLMKVLMLIVGFVLVGVGCWLGVVWRPRRLLCPRCGTKGHFIKVECIYEFRCGNCGRSADSGVDVTPDWVGDSDMYS